MGEEPRRRDSTVTRERILDATAGLLAERGTTATGMNQVVEASGVSYGSVYNQFRSGKDALIAAAIESAGTDVSTALAGAFDVSASLEEATELMFTYGAALLESSDFTRGCPVGTAIGDGHRSAAVRTAAATSFTNWETIIEERAIGFGACESDARRFASVAISLYEGALLVARARRTTDPLDAARDAAVALAERATP
jgi:TetR/AcrR family transcriptional repressor of lmrAB and yxaGH operons